MAAQLWLQEERTVLDEPGGGLVWDFGPLAAEDTLAALRRGEIAVSGAVYEPVGGQFMGVPSAELADCGLDGWLPDVPADWLEAYPFVRTDGYSMALHHTTTATWSLREQGAAAWGEPRIVSFITYESGDGGTGDELTIEFGGVWRLSLLAGGSAALSESALAAEGTDYTPRGEFRWRNAGRFTGAGGSVHSLWIYEVGPKLVIRNAAEPAGLALFDPGAQHDPLSPVTSPYPHALRPGPWRIAGSGRVTIAVARQRFLPGISRVEQPAPTALGLGGSTQPVTVTLAGLSSGVGSEPAVSVRDEFGALWPTAGGPFGTPRHAARWSVTWTTGAEQSYFLCGLSLRVPRTTRGDGNTGTEVLALDQVADREVSSVRDGDLTRERFTARLLDPSGSLAGYVQPNMSVRYQVGAETLFRGLTDAAEWHAAHHGSTPLGLLTLRAQGLWKRFRKARWPGGEAFDGRLLTEVMAELLAAAGLGEADSDLPAWDYRFPPPPDGAAPALVYRPGVTIDRILEELRERFFGAVLTCYFRLSDGKFVLEPIAGGESAATFYTCDTDAGGSGRVILAGSYRERLDESRLANVVTVIGAGFDGRPIVARAVDWASLRDPEAVNYIGEPWPLEVIDQGLRSSAAVAYVCHHLFARHRFARIYAEWRSVLLGLSPGQLVTISDTAGSSLWRLEGVSAVAGGSDPVGSASYLAERLA